MTENSDPSSEPFELLSVLDDDCLSNVFAKCDATTAADLFGAAPSLLLEFLALSPLSPLRSWTYDDPNDPMYPVQPPEVPTTEMRLKWLYTRRTQQLLGALQTARLSIEVLPETYGAIESLLQAVPLLAQRTLSLAYSRLAGGMYAYAGSSTRPLAPAFPLLERLRVAAPFTDTEGSAADRIRSSSRLTELSFDFYRFRSTENEDILTPLAATLRVLRLDLGGDIKGRGVPFWEAVSRLQGLTEICLVSMDLLTRYKAAALASLPHLATITLEDVARTEPGSLASLGNVAALNLTCDLGPACLEEIGDLTRLTSLEVRSLAIGYPPPTGPPGPSRAPRTAEGTPQGDATLRALRALASVPLKHLFIDGLEGFALEEVARMTALESLDLPLNAWRERFLPRIVPLAPKLRALSLIRVEPSPSDAGGADALAHFIALRRLTLCGTLNGLHLDPASDLVSVGAGRSVQERNAGIPPFFTALPRALASMAGLRSLQLMYIPIAAADLKGICAAMTALSKLELVSCLSEGLEPGTFEQSSRLIELDMSNVEAGNREASISTYSIYLAHNYMYGNNGELELISTSPTALGINDASLETLRLLGPTLRTLALRCHPGLTCEGILSLAPYLTCLTSISLGMCPHLTDRMLGEILIAMPQLRAFEAGGDHGITEDGLGRVAAQSAARGQVRDLTYTVLNLTELDEDPGEDDPDYDPADISTWWRIM